MAQEYKLRSFEKGDYQDPHGNYWCTAVFEGVGEPVKWVVKNPMNIQEGQTYYGEIKELTSKAGKPYMRFYKQSKPEGAQQASSSPTSGYKDNSEGQRQGMCFNNAAQFVTSQLEMSGAKPSPEEWADLVFTHAQTLYARGDLKTGQLAEAPVDKVFPVKEDEPIDLNDIPF